MAKLSRKARKVLTAQKMLTSKVAVAIVAATLASAPVHEMEPKPVATLTIVADAAPSEPVSWSERLADSRPIPPPSESGVRLVTKMEPDPKELTRRFRAKMARFDNERRFDWAVHALRFVFPQEMRFTVQDVLSMAYCVTLSEFLLRCRNPEALARIRIVRGITLWSAEGVPTAAGKAAWEGFRIRIRREGAHMRIVNNQIRSSLPAPVVRIDRYRSVERVA